MTTTTIEQEKTTFVKLLEHLHRGGTVAHWWNGHNKISTWFNVSNHEPLPDKLNHGNVYFSVHPCTSIPETDDSNKKACHVKSRISHVAAVNCLYADFDLGDDYPNRDAIREHLLTLPLYPSVIIDSGGLQCYWLLANTVAVDDNSREHLKGLQYAWVDLVGSDATVKDLARILRVPGTLNIKPQYAPEFHNVVIEYADLGRQFSLEQFEQLTEKLRAETVTNRATVQNDDGTRSPVVLSMDDQELIKRLCRKPNAARLWDGDASNYYDTRNGKIDLSAANQALCNDLAFYTGKDRVRMDLLFRQSGLYRDKWERDDYRNATIDKAIAGTHGVYDPNYRSNGNGNHDSYNGFAPNGHVAGLTSGDELKPEVDAGDDAVTFVADMLKITIDAGRSIDDLRAIVTKLSDAEREKPVILEQLSRVYITQKGIDRWLRSCGRVGDSNAERWVAALRRLPYDFALNLLEDEIEVDGRRLDDVTRSKIYLEMEKNKVSKSYVDDVINLVASEATYHPVEQYLNGLVWDGKNHMSSLLAHIKGDGQMVNYSNGPRPLHHTLLWRWFLGCVARGLDGGKETAFRHQTPVLVFVGGQGAGKSSLVRWLASGIGFQYHQEGPVDPARTEDKRSMVTKWLWEISELGSSLRRSDRDSFKGFVTLESHTFRKPWGRSNITKPTLCNLVGTINGETGFLDDPTGNRRFLPVDITSIDWRYEKNIDVNQLWAQLVHEYKNGASPELSKIEREALAKTHEQHTIENPLETYVRMYFDVDAESDAQTHTAVILQRLREFGISLSPNNRVAGRELNDVLAPMGLRKDNFDVNGVKGRGWVGIKPNNRQPHAGRSADSKERGL